MLVMRIFLISHIIQFKPLAEKLLVGHYLFPSFKLIFTLWKMALENS